MSLLIVIISIKYVIYKCDFLFIDFYNQLPILEHSIKYEHDVLFRKSMCPAIVEVYWNLSHSTWYAVITYSGLERIHMDLSCITEIGQVRGSIPQLGLYI